MTSISIVTTLYNSAQYIEEFYSRTVEAASAYGDDFEIVMVNDGSTDSSLELAKTLHIKDSRVKIIDLSRNFGHHKAIMTGLAHSSGEQVFLLDSDLEQRPEWLHKFIQEAEETDADAIVAVRNSAHGNTMKRIGGNLFSWLFNQLSSISIPSNVTIARLMTKRYVTALLNHKEHELFFAGLCELTGFYQRTICVDISFKGSSDYNLSRSTQQAINAITSFSNKPLYIIFGLGCVIFAISGVYIGWIIFQKLVFGLQTGFASLIASIWTVGGITMMCTGIIGIYLAKVYAEIKARPTIIRRIYENKDEKAD